MYSIIRNSTAAAAVAAVCLASLPALSANSPNRMTYWNIQKYFGVVPKFFQLFPEAKLPTLWNDYKKVQLDPNTALDAKTKQLIGLAAAVQAKCSSCIYFQTSAAFANGATFKEVQETVAISVIEDDWSKILTDTTFEMVKADTNTLISIGTLKLPTKAPAATN